MPRVTKITCQIVQIFSGRYPIYIKEDNETLFIAHFVDSFGAM